jgi:hypothetical protein
MLVQVSLLQFRNGTTLYINLLFKWSHTSDSQKASLDCIPDTDNTSLCNYMFSLHIDTDDMASVLST